jgi:site-specific DNA-methyltransferase (adenine-specific)
MTTDLKDLKAADYNPRRITKRARAALEASLLEFGDLAGLTFNAKTGNMIAGHQRKAILEGLDPSSLDWGEEYQTDRGPEALGTVTLPDGSRFTIRRVSWTLGKEMAANVAANHPALAGEFVQEDLDPLLAKLKEDDAERFRRLRLGLLASTPKPPPPPEDLDDLPDPGPPQTALGDVIELGPHLLHCGDSLDVLQLMEDSSLDSMVSDPPSGIAFMSKAWDTDKGGRDQWIAWLTSIMVEVLRVLKPGAHGLIWALPRTSHWTATALEDSGFEIRDQVDHLFWSGFPKSLSVGRAVDDYLGADREVTGTAQGVGSNSGSGAYNWNNPEDQADRGLYPVTAPATPEARKFEGWGTGLKPAHESWILVRKPLEGTVAATVLKYGTGGINVDGCRIQESDPSWPGPHSVSGWAAQRAKPKSGAVQFLRGVELDPYDTTIGRWPANLYYCPKPAVAEREAGLEDLPALSAGQLTGRKDGSKGLQSPRAGAGRTSREGRRNIHVTVKPVALMRWLVRLVTPPGGTVLDPFAGSGTTLVAAELEGKSSVGVELDPVHCDIARARLAHFVEGEGSE